MAKINESGIRKEKKKMIIDLQLIDWATLPILYLHNSFQSRPGDVG